MKFSILCSSVLWLASQRYAIFLTCACGHLSALTYETGTEAPSPIQTNKPNRQRHREREREGKRKRKRKAKARQLWWTKVRSYTLSNPKSTYQPRVSLLQYAHVHPPVSMYGCILCLAVLRLRAIYMQYGFSKAVVDIVRAYNYAICF